MSVKNRGGSRGWYVDVVVTYPDGTSERRKRKSPINTKRDAQRFERELRQQMLADWNRARMGLGEVPTLTEFSGEFLAVIEGEGLKPSTLDSYRTILEQRLEPHFGDKALDEVTARDVEAFKRRWQDERSAKTIRNYLTVLSKLFTTARRLDIIRQAPLIEMPRAERPSFQFWDFDEAARVLKHLHTEPLIDGWVRLALSTGLRCGELAGLQWGDVDTDARQLHVRRQVYELQVGTPKSNRQRTVPLSDAALEALRLQRPKTGMRALGTDADWVFWHRDENALGRTPHGWVTDDRVKRPFWRVIEKAGVKRIRLHDLRHTFASHCVMRGVPIEVLQQWLGHADIKDTMRYAHLEPEHTHGFVELLNEKTKGKEASDGT